MLKKICIVLSILLCSTAVQAETLNISVAASMTNAFKEIISVFNDQNPDTKIQPNFASSGSLAKQIAQGAPADLFVSANPKWMKYLVDNGMIEPGTDIVFVANSLVFTGNPDSTATDMASLVTLKRIAIGTPQSVPAGQYAKEAMEKAGVWQKLKDENKLVMAKDVRQALIYADRGETDGAFVYRTDALLAKNAKILFAVPQALYSPVVYPMAITTDGAKKPQVTALYHFIKSDTGNTILEKYGFKPVL
ncbi:molybdate ABC transporter substrate-binding protein [Desulforhopalus vacuolatus]|uniref:molybdate ABC transporter substrate-binding protein n=1 Tax=Desulforhopalus vacuolatus TaxID=40414 RepID=UPI001963A535|nr:molybdate ABC transporter substrate-binding protein [Desulforhopalus vacuolatus]MBM9521057.1 molybdate ABC transporter substrate-binding protein [Desulforhopalus vacuolatus]